MPYYRHLKAEPPETGVAYPTVLEARDGIDPKVYAVTFTSTDYERLTWMAREITRFDNGEYLPVPWVIFESTPWRIYLNGDEYLPLHYAHLSIKIPGLVAYTKSEEHGFKDRQTRVKPGRYLEEYYSNVFDQEQIAAYIGQCKAENLTLKIARTAQEIARVYIGGPSSCMGGSESRGKGDRFKIPDLHPCCVYGDSDLGVAYTGETDRASARAVVWPDKMIYSRVYGDCATLCALLVASGYHEGSVKGAHIRYLTDDCGILMPYIDGINTACLESDEWIVLGKNGGINPTETCGRLGHNKSERDGEPDPDPDVYRCERCNTYCDGDGDGDGEYCNSCLDERVTCDYCDRAGWFDTTSVNDNTENWCDSCIEAASTTCDHTEIAEYRYLVGSLIECDESWTEPQEFTRAEQEARKAMHVTRLCRTHALNMQGCAHCGAAFDDHAMACSVCNLAVLCEWTLSLPGMEVEAVL